MDEDTSSLKDHRRDRERPLRVLVSIIERREIDARATSACLSRSAYLRAAALSHPIKRLYDLAAVEQLAGVGVELKRLVDALTAVGRAPELSPGARVDLQNVIEEIRPLSQQLLELMSRV